MVLGTVQPGGRVRTVTPGRNPPGVQQLGFFCGRQAREPGQGQPAVSGAQQPLPLNPLPAPLASESASLKVVLEKGGLEARGQLCSFLRPLGSLLREPGEQPLCRGAAGSGGGRVAGCFIAPDPRQRCSLLAVRPPATFPEWSRPQ